MPWSVSPAALLIYLTASEDRDLDENVQTIAVDGKTFQMPVASTKMYRRELQRYGGDAAVLFDESKLGSLWTVNRSCSCPPRDPSISET